MPDPWQVLWGDRAKPPHGYQQSVSQLYFIVNRLNNSGGPQSRSLVAHAMLAAERNRYYGSEEPERPERRCAWTVPATSSPRDNQWSATFAVPQHRAPSSDHNRVLVADDDTLVRGSLGAVLESEGYVVEEASTGRDAVHFAIIHSPTLVLLDLNMPDWDGWNAFERLDRIVPTLPVIVITARPNQYGKAVELGVDAFMEKPLNIPILIDAVKRLASKGSSRCEFRAKGLGFVTEWLGNTER